MARLQSLRAGDMRDRVTIQRNEPGAPGTLGDLVDNWINLATNVPADVETLQGTELFRARQVHSTATVKIRIYYDSRVTAECRFVLDDGGFAYIVSAIPDSRRRWLFCTCEERT